MVTEYRLTYSSFVTASVSLTTPTTNIPHLMPGCTGQHPRASLAADYVLAFAELASQAMAGVLQPHTHTPEPSTPHNTPTTQKRSSLHHSVTRSQSQTVTVTVTVTHTEFLRQSQYPAKR